jgi:hypothetical protein
VQDLKEKALACSKSAASYSESQNWCLGGSGCWGVLEQPGLSPGLPRARGEGRLRDDRGSHVKPEQASESLGGLITQVAPRAADSMGLGWGLRLCLYTSSQAMCV